MRAVDRTGKLDEARSHILALGRELCLYRGMQFVQRLAAALHLAGDPGAQTLRRTLGVAELAVGLALETGMQIFEQRPLLRGQQQRQFCLEPPQAHRDHHQKHQYDQHRQGRGG